MGRRGHVTLRPPVRIQGAQPRAVVVRTIRSKCQTGSCTLAIDHHRTQALITLLAATPKAQLLTALFALCNAYTYGAIRVACSVFAAVFVLFHQHPLQTQLTDSDHGHGVYITWLTVNIHNLPGITPQK